MANQEGHKLCSCVIPFNGWDGSDRKGINSIPSCECGASGCQCSGCKGGRSGRANRKEKGTV